MSNVGKNLERFRIAVSSHDRENPDHDPAYGVGLAYFDMARLGFDEGEELWPGVRVMCDGGTTGNFRVICGYDHENDKAGEAEYAREITRAVGVDA